jgi:hypothetical protein
VTDHREDPATASASTRSDLQLVAVHILARRRFEVSGRFGLRASPAGFATPAFGDPTETIRVAGLSLIRELDATSTYRPLRGATLRQLAEFAGTDIDAPFSSGADTPAVGDPDRALDFVSADVARLADWYALAWNALDAVLLPLPAQAEPAIIQLWPEHFDAATNVGLPSGDRINLGFSPGDAYDSEPYVSAGPWSRERRGDPAFWNAPFGARLRATDVDAAPDRTQACIDFLRAGIAQASAEE